MMEERLKQVRTNMGLSQTDFAKRLGIGQSTLAMMEVGKRAISERHIKTVCALCKVREEWFRRGGRRYVRPGQGRVALRTGRPI